MLDRSAVHRLFGDPTRNGGCRSGRGAADDQHRRLAIKRSSLWRALAWAVGATPSTEQERVEAALVNGRLPGVAGPAINAAGIASVRVILGEPPSAFRASVLADLARRAELDVVAVGTSTGIVRACVSRRPDIALVADDLPPDGGVGTVQQLATAAPDVRVVVWGDEPSGDDALAAFRAGARGVLTRHIGYDALTRSIMRVAAGEVALPRDLERVVVDALQAERRSPALTVLSAREREVLALVADGRGNRDIAATLGISEFTVKRHVHNILGKFDVPSRAAAARLHGSAGAGGAGSRSDGEDDPQSRMTR